MGGFGVGRVDARLRWFRQNVDIAGLACGQGISRTTGYLYLTEVIDVLAEQTPDLHDARHKAAFGTTHFVLTANSPP